ncbi:hypothetical protein [Alteraurantiacibacter palmitatis]|uniref:TrbI/VirB10 family protein n=1 Tax=Alteraurantiacibacter palmitatis TaxID=2054628 RepID=A0ABV7E615_9SPHN
MKFRSAFAFSTSALFAFAVHANAQDADGIQAAPVTLQAVEAPPAPAARLPANTEILLRMNQEVTTRGDSWSEGDSFAMSVVHPVMLGGYVVIPAGTRAVGRITYLTNRGAFGKSGKMDIELQYLELGGQRVNLDGTYRQEGEGNTLATVGGVVVAGVFAGFITGKSAVIPQGRELMATLEQDVPVSLPPGVVLSSSTTPVMLRR